MGQLSFDVGDAFKSLRRSPGYTATVMATLALTIGGTTAVFSIVNGVLLKPLAYREAHQLVAVREIWREDSPSPAGLPVNENHFEYWREHAHTFSAMAQYIARPANLTGAGDAVQVTTVRASGSLFDVLQIHAATGRLLTPDDERPDRPHVAVLSDAWWRQRYHGDSSVIGRILTLDDTTYAIVGILPQGFRLWSSDLVTDRFDVAVPIRMSEERVGWYGDHNNRAVGRLGPSVTIEAAQAELNVLQRQVSVLASNDGHERVTLASAVLPLTETVVGGVRRALLLLFGAVTAVLLIACSNLANLALTRTLARQRAAAIRAALGATRTRLIARVALEHVMLSGVAGAVGLVVAWAALRLFIRTAPIDLPRVEDVTLDRTVFAFAAGLSIAAGLLVAVLPSLRTASRAVQAGLRGSGSSYTSDGAAGRSRAALLALQVATSVTLLVVTTLLSLSFVRVVNADRGFEPDGVLAVNLALPANRYADERVRLAAYDRLLSTVRALPGVSGVTTTSMIPLGGEGQVNFIVPEGDVQPRTAHPSANFRFVAPEFFSTLGVTVLRGRSFTDRERDPRQPAPVVVSQTVAARLWAGAEALGKRFSRGFPEQPFEVVGIVADARTTSLETPPPLMVYVPYWWRSRTTAILLVKSGSDPAALLTDVRQAIRSVDPDIAIGEARPLDRVVDSALALRRYQLRLFLAFGATALAIALISVYATTAYGVSRRRREVNIRVALGADQANVLRLMIRQTAIPMTAGLAAGILGAIAVGGFVASLLFDVQPRDPIVIAAVTAIVGAVALLASVVAARQGLVIDPAGALREE